MPRFGCLLRSGVSPILKYLVAVTDHLASLSFLTGLILSFVMRSREKIDRLIAWGGMAAGILLGFVVFGVRMYDPKGMNLPLTRFNRWVVVAIAVVAAAALLWALLSSLPRRVEGA